MGGMESRKETNQLLFEAHFPGCQDENLNENGRTRRTTKSSLVTELITQEQLLWAIGTLEPYKSPG